jgi:uncharacterized protein
VTSDLRIVLDTSVAISAAMLPRSVPRLAFDVALDRGRLLVSVATITELDEVFRRPKFNKYVTEELRLEFLAALIRAAELVEVTVAISDCRDPNDNKFLDLAISGHASHLVSGDDDLLVLNPYQGCRILTPRDFITLTEPANPSG